MFENENQPVSAMTLSTKLICFFGVFILVVAVGLALTLKHPVRPMSPVAFYCLGVSNVSNTSLVSIGITNQSGSTILCLPCPPMTNINGLWINFQSPDGAPMLTLPPGTYQVAMVTNPPSQKEIKVPILWGFSYDARASRFQQVMSDALWSLSTRNLPGRGMLYTNYLTVMPP
jgi:hypothetical protein